jgi:hypothetical protein
MGVSKGIRFPDDMHQQISDIAREREVTFTDIVLDACAHYLSNTIPGLCPSCHTQNDPSSQYCSASGTPLEEEGRESILELITTQQKLEAEIEELKKALSLYLDVDDRMRKLEENMSQLKNKKLNEDKR